MKEPTREELLIAIEKIYRSTCDGIEDLQYSRAVLAEIWSLAETHLVRAGKLQPRLERCPDCNVSDIESVCGKCFGSSLVVGDEAD